MARFRARAGARRAPGPVGVRCQQGRAGAGAAEPVLALALALGQFPALLGREEFPPERRFKLVMTPTDRSRSNVPAWMASVSAVACWTKGHTFVTCSGVRFKSLSR